MSKVIIDIMDKSKEKPFLDFLKSLPFIKVQEDFFEKTGGENNLKEIFGIWKGRDITQDEIRNKAWNR